MSARRRPYLVAALVACALLGVGAWAASATWAPERALRLLAGTGWSALGALLLSLCASPLGVLVRRLTRRRVPVAPWRRLAGIAAAVLATVHGGIALSTYLVDAWAHIFSIAWLRAGASALLVLSALWLTSYPRVTRALRIQHWKALHRLAYVAGLLAFQHAILAPFTPRPWVLAVFGLTLVLSLFRLLPRPKRDIE
ncbi:MAG: ferric reductase-like transmembrane domain-containing protein [Sandaracinaceae bacterium]